jgi:hypothetical protein
MPNKNRTLVKLDDKIIEIKNGKKGLTATQLTEDDMFEVSLLDEGFDKLLENDVNKLANEAYTELQQSFKDNLKCNALKIIGFNKDRWHDAKWEVDHCNGRTSAITELMTSKVRAMFAQSFDAMIQPEIDAMTKPLKAAALKEFKDTFTYQVKNQMREQATKAAAEFLEQVMKKEVTKFQRKAIEKAEIAFLGRKSTPAGNSEE